MVSHLEEPSEGAGPDLIRARETPAPREPGRDQLVAERAGAARNRFSRTGSLLKFQKFHEILGFEWCISTNRP